MSILWVYDSGGLCVPGLVKAFKTVCVCMCVLCVAQEEEALGIEGERERLCGRRQLC